MKRSSVKTVILALASLCLSSAVDQPAQAAAGTVSVRARDSHEGFGLAAQLFIYEPLTATIEDPPDVILGARTRLVSVRPIRPGSRSFALEEGTYIIETRARGYQRMRTYFYVQPLRELPIMLWMDSTERSGCKGGDARLAGLRGTAVFHGHVFDARTGRPLPRASVRLERAGVHTQADGRGYFSLQLPVAPATDSAPPARDDLLIEFPGLQAQRHPVVLGEGSTHRIVDLVDSEEPVREDAPSLISSGVTEASSARALLLQDFAAEAPGLSSQSECKEDADDAFFPWRDGVREYPPLGFRPPPETLRVGTGAGCGAPFCQCDGAFCPGEVDVVSLETYVKRGLDNEWAPPISGSQALRAGAIAYRGYGAFYFYNPLRKDKYDICSSPRCQSYDRTTTPAHEAAADATAGILLERKHPYSGEWEVLQAEHSLENNNLPNPDPAACVNPDLRCGDGSAGSEEKGWPCLADEVCKSDQPGPRSEYYCWGHGRGMCQQGTDRWDRRRGKLWNWIVDHYYNDNYNLNGSGYSVRSGRMTSPIQITDVRATPSRVEPGRSFNIRVSSTNRSETTHDRVIVTASLLMKANCKHIIDPAHDRRLRVRPGDRNVDVRRFDVPRGTLNGSYDLIVSFWLDTNGDGVAVAPPDDFEGHYDQPLVSFTVPDAVRIESPSIPPFIYYRFNQGDILGRTVRNWGPRQLDGSLVGNYWVVPGASGSAIQLDGTTTYVEVHNSRALAFQQGVEVEAFVWRAANVDEDAVASKWYGAQDEWLLTFYPGGNGLLLFSVRLQDGSYATLEYPLPNPNYLRTWVHVRASYVPGQDQRLFWNGRLVAQRAAPPIAIFRGSQPVHVGDAGPGTVWSRFRGRIDEVRIRPPNRP